VSIKLDIRDFGPIAVGRLDLKPLTLLIGKNNTGKSYSALLLYSLTDITHRAVIFTMRTLIAESEKDTLSLLSDAIQEGMSARSSSKTLFDLVGTEVTEQLSKNIVAGIEGSVGELTQDIADQLTNIFGLSSPNELVRWGQREAAIVLETDIYKAKLEFTERLQTKISIAPEKFSGYVKEFLQQIEVSRDEQSSLDYKVRGRKGRPRKLMRGGNVITGEVEYLLDELSDFLLKNVMEHYLRHYYGIHYLPAARSGLIQAYLKIVEGIVKIARRVPIRGISLPPLSGPVGEFIDALLEILEGTPAKLRRLGPFLDISFLQPGRRLRLSRRFRLRILRLPSSFPDLSRIDLQPVEELAKEIEESIISGSIEVKRVQAGSDIVYRARDGEKELSLNRTSSSISELAPLVLYLKHRIYTRDVLIIEEPEAHLHPGSIVALARIFSKLVNRGVKLLITTHSDWLLSQISNQVAASKLPPEEQSARQIVSDEVLRPDQVAVYLFTSEPEGCTIQQISVDSEGIPLDEFAKIQEELQEQRISIAQVES